MAKITEKTFTEKPKYKADFDEVVASLKGVKGRSNQRTALCPAHDDSSASLSVKRGEDNKAVLHCFAGCSYENILRSIGLWQEPTQKAQRINSRIVATYDYYDDEGEMRYQVVRYEPKSFRQRRPDGMGGWVYSLDGVQRLLYNLPALLSPSKEPVFIVEGEKDVDNLTAIGAIATTNSGGAGRWEKAFNKYFANRDVIIIADNHSTGMDHAEMVSKEVYRSASSVKIVTLPVREKGDVSDFLEEGNTLDDLLYFCREVNPLLYTEEDLQTDPADSHSLEAEMAFIGAVFANPANVSRAIDHKLLKHFFDKKMTTILAAMISCFENSEEIDYITVGNRLGTSVLERLGGYDFLRSLEDNVPNSYDIDAWTKIIIAKSQYRELVKLGKNLTSSAEHEAKPFSELAKGVMEKVYDLSNISDSGGLQKMSTKLEDVIVGAREAVGKGLTGISTGFTDLDYITSGLQDTDLVIVAGRPSMGKTSVAMNIASHAALHEGKNVAVFSLEMSSDQLISKLVCSEAFVNAFDFKNGSMGEQDWNRISEVLPRLDEAGLYIDDTAGIGITELRSKALRMKQEHGLDLVVVDYLQLMSGPSGSRDNRQQEVSQISRDLKAMAKELRVPVIVLSQLNRSPEARAGNKPMLSDLRESGSIEQDADIVMFVYRKEYYNPEDPDAKDTAELIIAKHRNGPVGTVQLAFLKNYTRFVNMFRRY